jgi:hypothetical protein
VNILVLLVKVNGIRVHGRAKELYIQSYIKTIMNQGDLYGRIAGWRREEGRRGRDESLVNRGDIKNG